MVTISNGHVKADKLPEVPSVGSDAQCAQRARSLSPHPAKVTDSDSAAKVQAAQWVTSRVLAGDSLLYARPVSLADLWAGHQQAAGHYNAWLMQGPRYAWGAFHTALTAVLYALVWVVESPPRLAVAAAVVAGCWFWS
jgi:hypothetical protein